MNMTSARMAKLKNQKVNMLDRIFDITIDQVKGSYKDFELEKNQLDYPLEGVTYPVDYGFIRGYTGEDTHDLDVFVGKGDLQGAIVVYRPDIQAEWETKMYVRLSKLELLDVLKEFKPVLGSHTPMKKKFFLNFIRKFRAK